MGLAVHLHRTALCLTVCALLVVQSHRAPTSSVVVKTSPVTAPEYLVEASRLAFLHNWQAAAPLFVQAERLFAARNDPRNTLYSHIGKLRGEIESESLPEASEYLSGVLRMPIAHKDLELRLFCLVAKGDIDFQIDPRSSEAVWNEVATSPRSSGRAPGEIARKLS